MTKTTATDGQFEKVKVTPSSTSQETMDKAAAQVKKAEHVQLINRLAGDKGMTLSEASAAAHKALK